MTIAFAGDVKNDRNDRKRNAIVDGRIIPGYSNREAYRL